MQASPRCNFIGIAYCGGQRPLALAALDARQKVLALSIGRLEDIHAFIAGQTDAVVVCGLPLSRPPHGANRPVEQTLIQLGLPSYQTPAEPQALHPPARFGLQLAALCAAQGFTLEQESDSPLLIIESHSAAAFQHLLGMRPFDSHSLEGRIQRQLMLFEREMPLPDPMDFFEEVTRHKLLHGILPAKDIYSPAELDALILAHIAFLSANQPEALFQPLDSPGPRFLLPQP